MAVQVAVGIIFNKQGDLLIAQRPPEKSYSGLWEFPGGKIEKDESVFQALQRELSEEIGIQVHTAEAWMQLDYNYSERAVCLHVWRVTEFSGEPISLEGQRIEWVPLQQLNQFQFLPGNLTILEKILN